MTTNVLLTGAGGNLAHFIHLALKASVLPMRVVGCNYNAFGAGNYLADVCYVVPPAKDSAYVSAILDICASEKIHIIMVGGMVEQRILAENRQRIAEATGAFVVSSTPEVLRKVEDKWEFVKQLARSGFDYPKSVLPQDGAKLEQFLDEVAYPYIIKDRFGGGSQAVFTVQNQKELSYYSERLPSPVIQEYLFPDDEEYTVGVFIGSNGTAAGSIVVKRRLGLGMTFSGQVLPDSPLGEYCERMMESAGCLGPVNVQLRLTERGPVAFEVNTRFSSTTSARAHYGYNEAEMCLRHFIMQEEIARPIIRSGRFFRIVEEVFVSDQEFEALNTQKRIENRSPFPA